MQNKNFIYSKESKPCWICGKLTNRIEINYEAPLCSDKCEQIVDNEYIESSKDIKKFEKY